MKKYSLQCAVAALLFYFAQNIILSLLTGSFNIEQNVSQIISYLFALILLALLIMNRERAVYFGCCGIKTVKEKRKIYFYLPLLLIPAVNLLYLPPARQIITSDIFMAVCAGIYISIIEELIFRGFLFRAVEERLNTKRAVVISSITFGLFHLVNLTSEPLELVFLQVVCAAAIGISLAVVFHITQSLLPCITIHALTDITAFLFAENVRFEIECTAAVIIILTAVFYGMLFGREVPVYNQ